jgi:hypothetical protein
MLNQDAFDLTEVHLAAAPVVELGRPGQDVVGDHRDFLQRTNVLEVKL